jgi:hypothetical protein
MNVKVIFSEIITTLSLPIQLRFTELKIRKENRE